MTARHDVRPGGPSAIRCAIVAPRPRRVPSGAPGLVHPARHDTAGSAASGGDGWGIAAFTGRSPHAAEVLAAQDAVYTLIERGPAATLPT